MPQPDADPVAPGAKGAKTIDLKGAQVEDERVLGPLGGVLVVARPDGISPEAWSGLDRLVLRALRCEEDESEEAVARLREDAEALLGIEHPALLRVLGFAKHKSDEFVALECPAGESVASLVARHELAPARALEVARASASALGELARRGRPHRDFSTSAVFVARDGTAKVVPVACPSDFRVEHRASPGGSYRGLPLYAAPELHESGGAEPTERSNVFAFGVAFYEMLARRAPFRGGTPTRVLLDMVESSPAGPSTVVPGLPPELDRICLRCMENDPERRFPGFGAVESTLRIASESVGFADRPQAGRPQSTRDMAAAGAGQAASSSGTSRARSARRMSGRQKWLLVAVGAAVVAALGLVGIVSVGGWGPGASGSTAAAGVFRQAEGLMERGRPEMAWRLLDSHRDAVRDADPAGFDDLYRAARAAHWTAEGESAADEGRWDDAARAFENALAEAKGPEDEGLRLRLDRALYRSKRAAADAAAGAGDWREAAAALAAVVEVGARRGVPESDLASVREEAAFVGAMVDALAAREAGDAGAERRHLFAAAGMMPGDRAVMARLVRLGAGPDAQEAALARSREALEAGERAEAERLAREAADLWPLGDRPAQILTYLADRNACELDGAVFVSGKGPWESWGAPERAKAFCIDPYEFLSEGARVPRTLVSAIEAAAACRKRGGRLCLAAEWRLACSGPEGLVYPYGNEYRFDACNTDGGGLAAPGTAGDCRSPFGVYDMSGNLAEWTADFVRGKGQVVAGGDWSSGGAGSTCGSVVHFEPSLASPRVGFRCCRPVATGGGGE